MDRTLPTPTTNNLRSPLRHGRLLLWSREPSVGASGNPQTWRLEYRDQDFLIFGTKRSELTMKRIEALALVAGIVLLAGCGGGGGGGSAGGSGLSTYSCSLSCLKGAPTITTSTGGSLTSGAGGTVTVSFELVGAYADLTDIHVALDKDGGSVSAGSASVRSTDFPLSSPQVTVTINVPGGASAGSYHPWIFLMDSSNNTGEYSLQTDFSTTKFFYSQLVASSGVDTDALSPYDVPRVTIAP